MQYALFYIDFFVNNIQKNHHLTALNGDFIIVCVTFLIMLSIGLSPFLHTVAVLLSAEHCVNALYRAFSISTMCYYRIISIYQNRVNALYRAFSISTSSSRVHKHPSCHVSMPFIGLSPFLRC